MLQSAAKAQKKDSQNVPVGRPSVGSLLRRLEPPRFLHAGSLAFLGLTLSDLISLKARGAVSPEKDINCIFLFLVGGPSQIDTWDLKPMASVMSTTTHNELSICKCRTAGIGTERHEQRLLAELGLSPNSDQYDLDFRF